MSLQEELLELVEEVSKQDDKAGNAAILLHAKAHMFHNKKIHKQALLDLQKNNITHEKFDELDEEN